MKLEVAFQRGDALTVEILPKAPETARCLARVLPYDGMVFQARWAGREIFVPLDLPVKPPRENQSIRASLGDVIYFREWEGSYDHTGFEAMGLFYGPEIVREWRGDAQVNVIGRIPPAEHELIQKLGLRIWRQGGESVRIRLLDG